MEKCDKCSNNSNKELNYSSDGNKVLCNECGTLCKHCNMWIADINGFCNACWDGYEVCQNCCSSLDEWFIAKYGKHCGILTGECCGGIYWCQCAYNYCKKCFEQYYTLECQKCKTIMEIPEFPYVQEEQIFCKKCNEYRLNVIVLKSQHAKMYVENV